MPFHAHHDLSSPLSCLPSIASRVQSTHKIEHATVHSPWLSYVLSRCISKPQPDITRPLAPAPCPQLSSTGSTDFQYCHRSIYTSSGLNLKQKKESVPCRISFFFFFTFGHVLTGFHGNFNNLARRWFFRTYSCPSIQPHPSMKISIYYFFFKSSSFISIINRGSLQIKQTHPRTHTHSLFFR